MNFPLAKKKKEKRKHKTKRRNVYFDEWAAVCWFPNDMEGQRVVHITHLFEMYYVLRILHFICAPFFVLCVVEMIDLFWA